MRDLQRELKYLNVDEKIDKIFLQIVTNWKIISENTELMLRFDINCNPCCRVMKYNNPQLNDNLIKAIVFAYTLCLII
jgi:hypothetical protein